MIPRCFQIQPQDNAATLIDDAEPGRPDLVGPVNKQQNTPSLDAGCRA